MFDEKMTVYNYLDGKWIRKVVSGVQWRHVRNETVFSGGVLTKENNETVTINCDRSNGYLPPADYDGTAGWTLNETTKKDVIVQDICDKEITDDYTINRLLKDNAGCSGIVTSVKDARNRPCLKIIKVVAK